MKKTISFICTVFQIAVFCNYCYSSEPFAKKDYRISQKIETEVARFETLTIGSGAEISHPNATKDDPKQVFVVVDKEIVFEPGATLVTKSNIAIRAKTVRGDCVIKGKRIGINGKDGEALPDLPNYPRAKDGGNGGRGRDEIIGRQSSSRGDDAEDGAGGGKGDDGRKGNDGEAGLKNISIRLEIIQLSEDSKFKLESLGGMGGQGGDGQNGQNGQDAGNGGNGGDGGNGKLDFGGSGGRGGNGGNGGKGGNGGPGGNGGKGGDGGDVFFIVDMRNDGRNPNWIGQPTDWNIGGKGGRPGVGGLCGIGGKRGYGGSGGIGGYKHWGSDNQRPNGDNGIPGRDGEKGANGFIGSFGDDGERGRQELPKLVLTPLRELEPFPWP